MSYPHWESMANLTVAASPLFAAFFSTSHFVIGVHTAFSSFGVVHGVPLSGIKFN